MKLGIHGRHRVFAEGLATVLSEAGHDVTVLDGGTRAGDAVGSRPFDALVVDLDDAGEATAAMVTDLLRSSPSARVVVLSGDADPTAAAERWGVEADAWASKSADLAHVLAVVEGRERAASNIADDGRPAGTVPGGDAYLPARFLTDREREVLQRLVKGHSTQRIAAELNVAYSTARTHIQNLLNKLGAHSKVEAVAIAVQHQLVTVAAADDSRQPA